MHTQLEFGVQDTSRLLLLPFPGYRAVVTEPDGSQKWVNLPIAGTEMFTSDHMAGGTLGGQWRNKRLPQMPADLSQVGYNQVRHASNGFLSWSESSLEGNRADGTSEVPNE